MNPRFPYCSIGGPFPRHPSQCRSPSIACQWRIGWFAPSASESLGVAPPTLRRQFVSRPTSRPDPRCRCPRSMRYTAAGTVSLQRRSAGEGIHWSIRGPFPRNHPRRLLYPRPPEYETPTLAKRGCRIIIGRERRCGQMSTQRKCGEVGCRLPATAGGYCDYHGKNKPSVRPKLKLAPRRGRTRSLRGPSRGG